MRRCDVEHPKLTAVWVVAQVSIRTKGANADHLSCRVGCDSDLGPLPGVLVSIPKPLNPLCRGPHIVQPVEDRIRQHSAVADAPTVILRPRDLLSIRNLRRSHARVSVHAHRLPVLARPRMSVTIGVYSRAGRYT